ncbi:MAG: DNA-binding protein [Candidatus Hadarchaeota archaeon]
MDEDLEEIKKKKMENMKAQMEDRQEEQEQKKKQMEQIKKQMLRQILTSEARSRLSNLRMARPKFTERVENQLIQIARTGRVETPLSDEQLKKILKKLQDNKKSINIRRK